MSRVVFKLPDLGEGTVEAEIVAWRVKPGDIVNEDDVIVEVMTEKAAVEVPAPVGGRVQSTTGNPGDMVPVGAELIVFETDADQSAQESVPAPTTTASPTSVSQGAEKAAAVVMPAPPLPAAPAPSSIPTLAAAKGANSDDGPQSERSGRVQTSPAIRRRAHEAGVDLTQLSGSGPNGRILRQDLEAVVSGRPIPRLVRMRPDDSPAVPATEEIKIIGIRRVIAQRMSEAKRNIPHFAYVEEFDVTELESLRSHLNSKAKRDAAGSAPSLTYLPFIVCGLLRILPEFPQCNALFDAERNVIIRHRAVHVGVATQTPDGLKVPVVRNAQSLSLWELAAEIRRVTEAARSGKATREELSGSTITVTSLGKLGGIASTPIINAPEVAIVGVNRAVERPMVYGGAVAIRRMMNLSSSFDHRFVDGHDAAALIQALKERIEHPATLFID